MADFFNNPMPVDGAHFIENPAKVTVERIARAIEYDADLADKYRSGTFFDSADNVRRAFELSRSFRDGKGKELRNLKAKLQASGLKHKRRKTDPDGEFERAVAQAWGGQPPVKHITVGDGGRKAIAAAIGRARGFVKTNIRNRGRYLRVYGGLDQVKAKGIKVGAIATRKWGSNQGLKGWKFSDKPLEGAVYGRNREGGSLMKFSAGASSASAFKKAEIAKIRKAYASEIKAANGRWWDVPAAKAAYESAVKGRRHSEHLSREQSDARMFARFGAGNLAAAYSKQASGVDGRKIRSRTGLGVYKPASSLPFGRGRSAASDAAPMVVADTAVVVAGEPEAPKTRRSRKPKSNPFSEMGYGEFGVSALQNPTGIGFLDSVENSVAGVPFVGTAIAPIVAPAALGAAAAAVHIILVPRLQEKLPEWAQPYSYTLGGSVVGIVSGLVAARSSDSTTRTVAGLIGGSAVAIGIGIDAYRHFVLKSSDKGDLALTASATHGIDEMGDLALTSSATHGIDDMSGIGFGALSGERAAFGDGGAYQVQTLGFAGDHSALSSMYSDAAAADAYFSGPDLDGVEGEAVLAGPASYMGAFGASPIRAAGQKRAQSRHAGLRGHRWGWAIKMVGFENFQKIAALPPEQRVQVIKQLREQAMASVQRFVDESKAAQIAATPMVAPDALSGYGTTLFSGGSY